MIGYISQIIKSKNEDLIVKIITNRKILTLYRFYGLRHSIINIGRKIDFDVDYGGVFMPRLRNIVQINMPWENDYNRLYYWQQFMNLLNKHLYDVEDISNFYFDILDSYSLYLQKQAPGRVLIEMYAHILEFEGRKRISNMCYLCEKELDNELVIIRGFIGVHKKCAIDNKNSVKCSIKKDNFIEFLKSKKSTFLNNEDILYLENILFLGL